MSDYRVSTYSLTIIFIPFYSTNQLISPCGRVDDVNLPYLFHCFKVLYANHKEFSRHHKTTVRMLTDMGKECIDLSGMEGYK